MVHSDYLGFPTRIFLLFSLVIAWNSLVIGLSELMLGHLTQGITNILLAVALLVATFNRRLREFVESKRIRSSNLILLLVGAIFMALLALWDLSNTPVKFLSNTSLVPIFIGEVILDLLGDLPTIVIELYLIWYIILLFRRHPPVWR